jgi:transcription-repair coupling factor (superfamily II helicase)
MTLCNNHLNIEKIKIPIDAIFCFIADILKNNASVKKIAVITKNDINIAKHSSNLSFCDPTISIVSIKNFNNQGLFNSRQIGYYLESLSVFKRIENNIVLFASFEASMKKSIPSFHNSSISCYDTNYNQILTKLNAFGYERVSSCTDIYQYAVRGSVIDFTRSPVIFNKNNPHKNDQCYRIDFLNDKPEAIFEFNLETQLRTSKITPAINKYTDEPEVNVPFISPVKEVFSTQESIDIFKHKLANNPNKINQEDIESLEMGLANCSMALLSNLDMFFNEPLATLYDYLDESCYLIFEPMSQEDVNFVILNLKTMPKIVILEANIF